MASKIPTNIDLSVITRRMRAEWDRRVEHDYRYWMSDGIKDDQAMFKVGERDLNILLRGLERSALGEQTALEIGCGVGRIARAAAAVFKKVIGIDVSESAIREARRLLADVENAELQVGNGVDLAVVDSDSLDLVYSFAALSSMPVRVIVAYLLEANRVLRDEGLLRLQVYLGQPQETAIEDTIAIRSFERGRFVAALYEAGFVIEGISEIVLPFDISDQEAGMTASLVEARKSSVPFLSADRLVQVLISKDEPQVGEAWQGSKTEHLMALARATQQLEAGEVKGAIETLRLAVSWYPNTEQSTKDLLAELEGAQGSGQLSPPAVPVQEREREFSSLGEHYSAEIWRNNLSIVRQRFPEVAATLEATNLGEHIRVSVGSSGLPVLYFRGTALDQPDKPDKAGELWAKQTAVAPDYSEANAVFVAGFAGGFHLRALTATSDKSLAVYEPRVDLLKAALAVCDRRRELERISALAVTIEGLEQALNHLEQDGQVILAIHPQTQSVSRKDVDQAKRVFWAERALKSLRPQIAVVGPIYGGSLPITGYVERALRSLGQRVRGIHLGGFHASYKELKAQIRNDAAVDRLESQYVEFLSDLVLERIAESPVDIVICMPQAPMSPRALNALREQGVLTAMWFVEDGNRFFTWKSVARYYDYMFVIQRDPFPSRVEAAGAGRAIYLPVACDPLVHRPVELEAEDKARWGSRVSFVGAGYHNRQQMFASLAGMDFKIWGTEWPAVTPFNQMVQEGGRRLKPEEYVKIFSASDVNLNLHSSSERNGVEPDGDFVNPRTFELAASGAFQLVDRRRYLPELFDLDRELVTFSNFPEMLSKIHHYLEHPDERDAVAKASRERVLSEHTYEHRMREMLGYIFADRYLELSRRQSNNPWKRVYQRAKDFPELEERLKKAELRGDEPKLDSLVVDIQLGQGNLNETEMKLLFLHHVKSQIGHVEGMRKGSSK